MIKRLVKRLIFGYRSSQEAYIAHLRKCGVKVGEHVEIFDPRNTVIETLNPHLMEIGDHVSMSGKVTILNHDYSVCVLKKLKEGEILGKQRATKIGNNVFLGYGCCILPGAVIEDNTIIGACAVVSGRLEGNSVYAGNPARRLSSVEEFYDKIKARQLGDACDIYRHYKLNMGAVPPKEVFHEYFLLFEGGSVEALPARFREKLYDHGNYDESAAFFRRHTPQFSSYEDFCAYAKAHINGEE
jgi:maltose O-acetyltransferase